MRRWTKNRLGWGWGGGGVRKEIEYECFLVGHSLFSWGVNMEQ